MYAKMSLILAAVAVVSLPLANSLQCYTCMDTTCQNPATVTCDHTYANATREGLKLFHNGVQSLNINNYSCMISRYLTNGTVAMDIRGCVMTGAADCGSQLKNQTWTRDVCKVCKTDSCNFANSVGASASSFGIVTALLVLAKVFSN